MISVKVNIFFFIRIMFLTIFLLVLLILLIAFSIKQIKKQNLILHNENKQRKEAEKDVFQSKERYQSLFDNAPTPLWEEDFSDVKKYVEKLKKQKVEDFRQYFKNNPDKVMECAKLIGIIDLNEAVLKLHEAKSKEDLLAGLSSIFTDKSYEAFEKELIAVAEGKAECEFEAKVKTLKGAEKDIFSEMAGCPRL